MYSFDEDSGALEEVASVEYVLEDADFTTVCLSGCLCARV